MAPEKIIVVVGATGNQGGSVARTFLDLPNWHVRAMTRNPSSEAAQELSAKGAELVKADMTDPASLTAAFSGAHAIFLNTDFWATYYPTKAALQAKGEDVTGASHIAYEYETTVGKNAVAAAAAVGPTLERLVISTLPSVSRNSGGKYTRALHTEAKAWITDHVERELPALADRTSLVILGAYNTNRLFTPALDPGSGKYQFRMPAGSGPPLPVVDQCRSTGPFVRALVEDEPPRTKLLAYDSCLTADQIVQRWSEASGREAVLVPVTSKEMHEKMGVQYEHLDAFDGIAEFGYTPSVKGIIEPSQLKNKPNTKSWEESLKEIDWDQVLAQ